MRPLILAATLFAAAPAFAQQPPKPEMATLPRAAVEAAAAGAEALAFGGLPE